MEEIKNFQQEQIIAGIIGESIEDWEKKLPAEIQPDMVDRFLGSDKLWHWHLKPEHIKDERKKQEYNQEREIWP
jgi:hypothetical protein